MYGSRERFVPYSQMAQGQAAVGYPTGTSGAYGRPIHGSAMVGYPAETKRAYLRQGAGPLTDTDAKMLEAQWKQSFADTAILPGIGLPSQGKGVVTITHTLGMAPMKINGLASNSALANNALYSSEFTGGRYLNLYEVMLTDTPGTSGGPSRVEIYTQALVKQGLSVAGDHFHWFGAPGMLAIHHQSSTDITPLEFTVSTIRALQAALSMTPLDGRQA